MRLRAAAFACVAFATVSAGAWQLAERAADHLERRTRAELDAAFAAAGQDWVALRIDGLGVALSGLAPDETSRFRVIDIARQIVDGRRVQDRITVAVASPLAPPPFALEILRNEAEVSLIGLVPGEVGRAAIAAGLTAAGFGATVTDMLETAEHPAPAGWAASLAFALDAVADLPRAQVQVRPGSVRVVAVAASEAERAALAARLEAAAPPEVDLSLALTAPRPVVAPYRVAYHLKDGDGRLVACTAEDEEAAAAIVAAAEAAGLAGAVDCTLGLGAPSPNWAGAAVHGIEAVAEMGGGGFAVTDLAAVLSAPPGIEPERLAAIGAGLDAALPDLFTLETRAPRMVETATGDRVLYDPEFRAVLASDGTVRLTGPLLDQTSQTAIVGYAEALFGHERVRHTTVLDPNLPEGWPGRVLTGVEALSRLAQGELAVTSDTVTVSGRSLVAETEDELAALFALKGNGPATIDVTFDAAAAAALAEAARPPEEVCAEEIGLILEKETILFAPGSAEIDDASADVVAAIAAVLATCPGAGFEIAGHTDAQGGVEANQALSERRAEAVRAALGEAGVGPRDLVARGYGPDRPIATNESEEGRALNRRIEFTLRPSEGEGPGGGADEPLGQAAPGEADGDGAEAAGEEEPGEADEADGPGGAALATDEAGADAEAANAEAAQGAEETDAAEAGAEEAEEADAAEAGGG